MRDFTRGVLVVVCLVLVAVASYTSFQAYKWKRIADQRGWRADQTAMYLFAPTEVTNAKGVPLRRVDLLDALLANAIHQKQ